jgi:regulator of sigma E protease
VLEFDPEIHEAESFGEACALGLRNTKESLLHVFKFLRKLVTGQISPTNLGGPGTILLVAGSEANVGISRLLLFLTLLSANLAIINFLPIPVLDGGHMLFLIYEGIVGKPVNEIWAMRLTVAGLVFILGLMAFVLSLDLYRFAQMLV